MKKEPLVCSTTHFGDVIRSCLVVDVGHENCRYEIRYLGYKSKIYTSHPTDDQIKEFRLYVVDIIRESVLSE